MPLDTMYPDWPQSAADLVPLPRVDGPKLQPFDFKGPQKIEFIEHLGEGLHAQVFKVRIHRQIYALKLFRFTLDVNWIRLPDNADENDREMMSALYDYAEPFSCECRAFGRLQETHHEELAVACFGYVLLDEDHELELQRRFGQHSMTGDVITPDVPELRTRFLGRDGRQPPIRGIVKEYGESPEEEDMQPQDFAKLLADIPRFQQLGIMHLDVAERQLVSGKYSDFSTAITTPHFVTTPELNPSLTPEMRSRLEIETFRIARGDFLVFDDIVGYWNREHEGSVTIQAFPGGKGPPPIRRYELRNAAARVRSYTYVDPRRFNWRWGAKRNNKIRRRVISKPPKWIYNCTDNTYESATLDSLDDAWCANPRIVWTFKDGRIIPHVG